MAESPRSLKNIPPQQGFLIGFLFGGGGLYVILISLGVLPSSGMNAPPLIGAAVGVVLCLPGILSTYYAIRNLRGKKGEDDFDVPSWLVTSLVLTILSGVGLWISLEGISEAFGGGGSLMTMRVGFGVGSVLCACAAALTWSYGYRRLSRKKKKPPLS